MKHEETKFSVFLKWIANLFKRNDPQMKSSNDTIKEIVDKCKAAGVRVVEKSEKRNLIRLTIPIPTPEQLDKRAKAREEFIAAQPPYKQDPTAVQLYHDLIEERIRCGHCFEFTCLKEVFDSLDLKVGARIEYRWHDWIRGDRVWSARGPISEIWDDEYIDPPKPLMSFLMEEFELVYMGEKTDLDKGGSRL